MNGMLNVVDAPERRRGSAAAFPFGGVPSFFEASLQKHSPRHETEAAISTLTASLELPAIRPGGDWALDAADRTRVVEFCEFYDLADLSADEKFALMSLTVASLDDYLLHTPAQDRDASVTAAVEALLRRDFDLHRGTVQEWARLDGAAPGADDDGAWPLRVTPLMRRIWSECSPAAGCDTPRSNFLGH